MLEDAQLFITSDSDFEFIELLNISADTRDLSGLTFSHGIDFTFQSDTLLLAPGDRIVIANNRAALEFLYPNLLSSSIMRDFVSTSGLANGGEQIAFVSDGLPVFDFSFDDSARWPVVVDGGGYSLVLIDAFSNLDLYSPINWRSSDEVGGHPGDRDFTSLAEYTAANDIIDPLADQDGDGISTIIEYATGISFDSGPDANSLSFGFKNVPGGQPDEVQFVLEFPMAPGVDDVLCTPEFSLDLDIREAVVGMVYLAEPGSPTAK